MSLHLHPAAQAAPAPLPSNHVLLECRYCDRRQPPFSGPRFVTTPCPRCGGVDVWEAGQGGVWTDTPGAGPPAPPLRPRETTRSSVDKQAELIGKVPPSSTSSTGGPAPRPAAPHETCAATCLCGACTKRRARDLAASGPRMNAPRCGWCWAPAGPDYLCDLHRQQLSAPGDDGPHDSAPGEVHEDHVPPPVQRELTVVCAWCKDHLSGPREGGGAVSHGICGPCLAQQREKVAQLRLQRETEKHEARLRERAAREARSA